jgi:hypothetical protein
VRKVRKVGRCECGKKHDPFAICLAPEGGDEKWPTGAPIRSFRMIRSTLGTRYFRFRQEDLTCEEQVTGLFDGGSGLALCLCPLFLLFPEDAK